MNAGVSQSSSELSGARNASLERFGVSIFDELNQF
jgi:hypothetical protein